MICIDSPVRHQFTFTPSISILPMMRNPEAEEFFSSRSARDEVGTAVVEALKGLREYELRGELRVYRSPYAVTANTVFCGAAGMADTFFRLRPSDHTNALATGAEQATIGPEWVRIRLFRPGWPRPDLVHWALKAYDFARAGI